MVIIVTSDQHLGYVNSNSDAFSDFLSYVSTRTDVTDFVLLGDFVDMWRRDVSGLFLEQHEILEKVLGLTRKMKVYCIAGNHDYHLLKLEDHKYPLEFLQNLTLSATGDTKYVFKHGHEFDRAQHEAIMEILCYNLSDENGQIRSDLWDFLTKNIKHDILDAVEELFDLHGGKDNYLAHVLQPPNQRLQESLGQVERKAYTSVQPGEILIFGHTHRPFVNTANNVVNSGSWVSDASTTNTFVELDGINIHLKQFHGNEEISEITQREEYPS